MPPDVAVASRSAGEQNDPVPKNRALGLFQSRQGARTLGASKRGRRDLSTQPLNEGRADELDSLDDKAVDGYAAIFEAFGEGDNPDQRRDTIACAASALRPILRFCVSDRSLTDPRYMQGTALRIVGLAWAINPALFPGSPSLHQLAEKLHCSASNLSPHVAAFSRLFGISNRGQVHDWRRRGHPHKKELNEPSAPT